MTFCVSSETLNLFTQSCLCVVWPCIYSWMQYLISVNLQLWCIWGQCKLIRVFDQKVTVMSPMPRSDIPRLRPRPPKNVPWMALRPRPGLEAKILVSELVLVARVMTGKRLAYSLMLSLTIVPSVLIRIIGKHSWRTEYFVCLITRVVFGVCHQLKGVQQGGARQAYLWDNYYTWRERYIVHLVLL